MTQATTLRVLHLADSLDGGGAEGVFRSTIAASAQFASSVKTLVADGNATPVSYVFSVRNRRRVARALEAFEPDVVHVQNYYHVLSPSVLWALARHKRRRPATRVVFTAHDYHLICPNSGMQHFPSGVRTNVPIDESPVRLWRRYDHRSRAHAALKVAQHVLAYRVLKLHRVFDDVIVPSRFLGAAVQNHGIDAAVHLVRNPLDIDIDVRGRDAADAGAKEQDPVVAAGVIRLAFVGRLVPEKGIAELITALETDGGGREAELHLFGDGPQREELERLAASATGIRRVEFHGRLPHDELWRAVSAFDALVIPSIWYENAPQVVIEAAAAGVPVLGNDLGGVAEMCGETLNAEVCDTADPRALSAALQRLTARPRDNALRHPHEYLPKTYERRLERIYRGRSPAADDE
ncbi:MAG: glycosyltransferase [Microbacterium sp.]|uniref:glycosyltransferase n=1 Tax=Microbacterium sp. TaxID=51671 RepID=UPI003BB10D75